MRWSDEIYFSLSPKKKLRIIRRPGERFYQNYIQERGPPPEDDLNGDEDEVGLHIQAIVGWEFKTPLIQYTTRQKNGKMSQKVYIEQILEPYMRKWIK